MSSIMEESRCDLLVVGAGSGGLTAARLGARVGADVILVDRRPPGGDCLYTGCVPSKALLKAARVAHEMGHAERWGISSVEPTVDLGAVMARVQSSIDAVFERDSPEALDRAGVRFVLGAASFVGPREVEVTSAGGSRRRIHAERDWAQGEGARRAMLPPPRPSRRR
jgi:pyruvate/2-oxoglutarate dehydrogenase complex dihydrolipoamide dehydrogenase (E3) component